MTASPPRVVFDCNIFVQMALNPSGSAGTCKNLVESGEISLFVSASILAEVAEVLSRPFFRQLVPDLTPERIEAFVGEIAALSIPISTCQKSFITSATRRMSLTSTSLW